jgi:predicted TIM-barrel fold metal-dependent hydrolase
MIIDAHSHAMHGGHLEQIRALGGAWTKKRIDDIRENALSTPQHLDVHLLVEQLEKYGINLQVVTPSIRVDANLLPGDAPTQLALAAAINDNMALVMEASKGKLIAAGNLPIGEFSDHSRQELERAIKGLGLRAINLPSTINGKPLDSPEYEPFWSAIEELDVPVYLHPLAQPGRSYEDLYDLPHTFGWPYETTVALARLVFTGVMERHPKLKIVSHHLGGGMIPFFMGRIMESNDATGLESRKIPPLPKPLMEYFRLFYYDAAVGGSAAAIRCCYEVFGADQILFAIDSPHGPQKGLFRLEKYPKVLQELEMPEVDREKILSGNARRILKLE